MVWTEQNEGIVPKCGSCNNTEKKQTNNKTYEHIDAE